MSFLSEPIPKMIFGFLVFVMGISFLYKGWNACVLGRFYYWSGFLPLTMISPWMTHLPPSKRSLIKKKEGMLAHIFIGPSFFLCAVLCLCAGSDLMGWPGTKTLNLVLNGGDANKPTAVSFDENTGRYTFPILTKSGGKLYKQLFESKISEDKDIIGRKLDKMIPDQERNIDGAMVKNAGGK